MGYKHNCIISIYRLLLISVLFKPEIYILFSNGAKKKCSFNFLKLFSPYAEMPMSADGRGKKSLKTYKLQPFQFQIISLG